ncbi:MAG TPA: hypothetical protein VGP32_05950 [Steroidobacteraceae bacterium]|nr:hypothetical protein [Steroidobacteraceae bacterium]
MMSFGWVSDWSWAIPIIVFNLILHVVGLAYISTSVDRIAGERDQRHPLYYFVLVMGATVTLATVLHGIEAGVWALAYTLLGAVKDFHAAMLYSLNAITTYGHESTTLTARWGLLGSLEALNGVLLFGLTTAFLYGYLQRAWPVGTKL